MIDTAEIDIAILSNTTSQWRKVAMIVGAAILDGSPNNMELSDAIYAERVLYLLNSGLIEARGDVTNIRFSEIRLAERID